MMDEEMDKTLASHSEDHPAASPDESGEVSHDSEDHHLLSDEDGDNQQQSRKKKVREKVTRLEIDRSIGVCGCLRDNIAYIGENEITYPVGAQVAFTCTDTLGTSYVSDIKFPVTAICVAPNLTVMAIAEENGDGKCGSIHIVHIPTQKRIRTLRVNGHHHAQSPSGGGVSSPNNNHHGKLPGPILCMAFSSNSKYLIAQSGGPTHDIMYWKWEGEKLLAKTTAPSLITRIRFRPEDPSLITISGPNLLRTVKLNSSYALKIQNIIPQTLEASLKVSDHAWFDKDTLIVLSETGPCMVYKTQEGASGSRALKMEIIQSIELELALDQNDVSASSTLRMETVATNAKGFVIAGASGYVGIYEAAGTGNDDPFMHVKSFHSSNQEHIMSIGISPNRESIMCYTKCNRVLHFPLGKIDMLLQNEDAFKEFPFSNHKGGICAMDICYGPKPLVVTVARDKLIRILDYDKLGCELEHQLPSTHGDPVSVAIHPNGSMLALAFKEYVRIYDVLIGELKEKGCIFLKQCNCVRFSHGGQYLACSTNLAIKIYGTYSATLIHSFTEHIGQVKSFEFARDDSSLFSIGTDGAIYTRSLESKQTLDAVCQSFETCQLLCATTDPNQRRAIVSTLDGQLREIFDGEEVEIFPVEKNNALDQIDKYEKPSSYFYRRQMELAAEKKEHHHPFHHHQVRSTTDKTITTMTLSHDGSSLFAGTSHGAVRVYKWPLSEHNGHYTEFKVHAQAIVDMKLSNSGMRLFTSSKDGTCFVQYVIMDEAISNNKLKKLQGEVPDGELEDECADDEQQQQDEEEKRNATKTKVDLSIPGSRRQQHQNRHFSKDQVELLWENDGDAILVSSKIWKSKLQEVEDLKKDVQDLSSSHEFMLHQKDVEWMETIRNNRSESSKVLQKERTRFEDLQSRHEKFVQKHIEEKQRMEADRIRIARNLENEYEKRLYDALRRADEKAEAVEELRMKTDELLLRQETAHVEEIEALKTKHKEDHSKMTAQVEDLKAELALERTRNEEIRLQQENEYELEILKLKGSAEVAVDKERDVSARKQGLLVQQRNRYDRLRSKMSSMKMAKTEDDLKIKKLEEQVVNLQDTLRRYEQNLEKREAAFREKEKTILNLRSSNKTLDNFRYVLDYRIEKLMEEKGPIQEHIAKLESHIKAMYNELVSEFHRKKAQENLLSNKEMKVEALAHEVQKLRTKLREKDREVTGLCQGITTCAKLSDTKQVMQQIAELYHVHVLKEPNAKRNNKLHAASYAPSMLKQQREKKSDKSTSGNVPSALMRNHRKHGQGIGLPTLGGSSGEGKNGSNGMGDVSNGVGNSLNNGSSSSSSNNNNNGNDTNNDGLMDDEQRERALLQKRYNGVNPELLDEFTSSVMNAPTAEENARQREYMQRTLSTLQKSLKTAERKLQDKSKKAVQENAFLIAECNRLRKEAMTYRQKCEELEGAKVELNRRLRQTVSTSTLLEIPPPSDNQRNEDEEHGEVPNVSEDTGEIEETKRPSTSHFPFRSRPRTSDGEPRKRPHSRASSDDSQFPQHLTTTTSGPRSSKKPTTPSRHSKPASKQRQTDQLMQKLLASLDEANREIIMQREEIRRLRSQPSNATLQPTQSAPVLDPIDK